MNGKVTYHQQVSYCGKPRCRKCREGVGHGPYWYAYQTIDGHTTRTYVGKHLPPGAEVTMESSSMETANALDAANVASIVPVAILNTVSLRVSVLGQFRLERKSDQKWQSVTETAWQLPQVRALLGYLLSSPGRRARREEVMAALWPGVEAATATTELKKTVHSLRQVIGAAQSDTEAPVSTPQQGTSKAGRQSKRGRSDAYLLHSEDDILVLAHQSLVWIDADAFEGLIGQARTVSDVSDRERVLEEALALYGGDYLPEERQAEWVLTRRQKLRREWIALLLILADARLAHERVPGAIDILDRLLAADPANEAAVQRLIVALAQLKRRVEALRAYHRLVDVLQREYKTDPSEETRALFEAVRRGEDTLLAPQQAMGTHDVATQEGDEGDESEDELPNSELKHRAGSSVRGGQQGAETLQPVQIGRTHQSPLVGRERELDVLRSVLLEVEQSGRTQLVTQRRSTGIPLHTQRRPQSVLLMGEAGIGKTRLAEEISRQAQQRGWSVMWSRVYAQESGIPYRLWTEALRKAMSQSTWHWQEVSKHPTLYQPLTALLPELGSMLPRKASLLTPEQEEMRLWEATRAFLAKLSESTPLLIVLDDIQWADESSCKLLAHLARNLQGYPILLLGTCRENEIISHPLHEIVSHMQREHTIMTLKIDPLTSEQIARLVAHLPEPMVQHIQHQAAGNPFFAEELARTSPPTLPRTVAAALDSRMSRLSASCQQLLGNAAVLGGSFELPVIYAMENSGTLADEDSVLDLLEEALTSGVLMEEGTGTRIRYHFWHPLLVSHLYDRVSAARRVRLHQRAAEILQRMYKGREEEVAATITHHLVRGGADAPHITHYAELAGDRAYALSAYFEAERHYKLAVEYREMETGADSIQAEQRLHFAYLLERLGECTMIRGDFVEARNLYERVLELYRLQRGIESEDAYQRTAQIQALLWAEIVSTWRITGNYERARACYERGEEVLREAGIVGGPAWARLRYQQSYLYSQEGRYHEAQQAAQEALRLFEQPARPVAGATETPLTTKMTATERTLEGSPIDLGRTYALLGTLANGVGLRSQALVYLNTALALYEQYDYKRQIAHVSNNLGYIYLKKGEYSLAQAALRSSLSLAERLGDIPLTSVVFSNLGELAAASGDLEEAEARYRRALMQAERSNDRGYMNAWNVSLANVLREQGKYEEAGSCIVRALKIGRAMHNAPYTGGALVALGMLRIAQALEAEKLPRVRMRLLKHAQEDLVRTLGLDGLEAETRTKAQLGLAQALLLLGEIEEAEKIIGKVLEEAQRYELAPIEAKARQLLERIVAAKPQ